MYKTIEITLAKESLANVSHTSNSEQTHVKGPNTRYPLDIAQPQAQAQPQPSHQRAEIISSNMDQISEQINELVSVIPPKFQELTTYIKQDLPKDFQNYLNHFKSIDTDELISDFKQLNPTPVTITISVIGITSLILFSRVLVSSKPKAPAPKPKKKKTSKAKKANKQIQEILDNFETVWVPQINEYFSNYKQMKPEDVEYKFNYFQEMLLKELFSLDEVDTLGNQIIRENRKKVIQFIQDHQKRLDSFKREIDL